MMFYKGIVKSTILLEENTNRVQFTVRKMSVNDQLYINSNKRFFFLYFGKFTICMFYKHNK